MSSQYHRLTVTCRLYRCAFRLLHFIQNCTCMMQSFHSIYIYILQIKRRTLSVIICFRKCYVKHQPVNIYLVYSIFSHNQGTVIFSLVRVVQSTLISAVCTNFYYSVQKKTFLRRVDTGAGVCLYFPSLVSAVSLPILLIHFGQEGEKIMAVMISLKCFDKLFDEP